MTESNPPISKLIIVPVDIADDDNTVVIGSVFSGSNGRFNSHTFNALVEVIEGLKEEVLAQQEEINNIDLAVEKVPEFREGERNPKGWVHEFSQGCRVHSKKDGQLGVVKDETLKSVWVLFDGEQEKRLKRKTGVAVVV